MGTRPVLPPESILTNGRAERDDRVGRQATARRASKRIAILDLSPLQLG
jgi:hypothetical protein